MYEHRITTLEADVKHLYSKVNGFAVASAEMNTKLDSMLVTLGELKESIKAVRERPTRLWDKLLIAVISAFGTAFGTALWLLFTTGG
ncbi:MAG: hypothetical protein ACI4K9_06430 [Candidatus Fimenecus sp.]